MRIKVNALTATAVEQPSTPSELWSEETFCKSTGTPKRTAQRWRATGEGPPYVRLGPRRVAYRPEDVAQWLEKRTYRHRADELSRNATGGA